LTTTVLILVRHGATRANVERPYTIQGLRPDSDLIDAGVVQAKATGQALQSYPIVHAYCSPLTRARQTAEVLADFLRVPLDVEPALVEADVGRWVGLTWAEIEQRWPAEYRAFHDDPERHGYPGGENLGQVRGRVLPAVEGLVARHRGETVLVVGHGLTNRVLLAHWLGLPLRYARQIPQDNAAFSAIEFRGAAVRVRTVNALAPLDGYLPDAAGCVARHAG
jgi:broad specificity phosphatase PhoE